MRRRDTLLLAGAVMVAIGGLLYFNPLHDEPWWAEWLLSSILVYMGLPLVIVGAAIHVFADDRGTRGSNHLSAAVKGHR
jgi:protein-S-isoprenylcysteine O-methyltransferase Ste14